LINNLIKNTAIETELLEALDWDEEYYECFIKDLNDMLISTRYIEDIKKYIIEFYGNEAWNISYKFLKEELLEAKND